MRWLALAAVTWLAAMAIVFRDTLASGFDLGFSDRGDGIIEIAILEHWRAVLTSGAVWNQPLYFHPHPGTLGYNDGYLLAGLFYTSWRTWFDPFLADTMTALTFRTVGFWATLWLVRGVLRWSWGVALLVALLAAISNNMFLQAGHAQINSLALLPVVAGLAILTVRRELAGGRGAAGLAALTAMLLGLWLVTAFYFAWFTIYFMIALAACWLWTSGRWRPVELKALITAHWRTGGAFVGTGIVAAIPFALVYLPKRIETGGHGFMISYLVQPIDPINVGEGNAIWGWIWAGVRDAVLALSGPDGKLARALLDGEHQSGFPILLFALFCVAAWRTIRQREHRFARAFALAIAISWVLTLRIWQVSPWILVHYLVPAASGVRVVLRYQLFLVLPVLLLSAYVWRAPLARLWRERPWVVATCLTLLVLEQVNWAQPTALRRSEQLAALRAIPAPPADCRAFYVVTARRREPQYISERIDSLYPHNVDAMLLAALWRVPTINGFSTFNPPDWDFARPRALDYDQRAASYARRHGLTRLCRLDMRDAQPWSRAGLD